MKKRSIVTLIVVFGALFVGFLVFVGVLVAVFAGDDIAEPEDQVGVVEIEGSIGETDEIIQDLRRWQEDDEIEAILVRIDSPGGAVAPSQELYHAIRRASEEKPLAVSMGNLAASGGYYAACGSDTIYANAGTITGSIGVITQFFNIESVIDTIDVEVHTVQSGEFKDSGSPFREFEDQDEELFTEMVFDIHEQFVEDVADCRDQDVERIEQLADGRVYTGRQAHEEGLVDEIGTFQDVVDHLADEAGLDDPHLVRPPEDKLGFFGEFLDGVSEFSLIDIEETTKPRVNYEYVGPQ